MSRIGKLPISIPQGVEVEFQGSHIKVRGPKGELNLDRDQRIEYQQEDSTIHLSRKDNSKKTKALYGLRRTLLNNAMIGVTQGFEKGLELVGVGYKVAVEGEKVVLNVGYSHPKYYFLPEGIQARTEGNRLFISGIDKELVGEVAAQIRRIRPPEPYKGKGIKYLQEYIQRKAGKSGKK